jgi:exodeoxyribonuclease V alpha subunit
VSGPLNDQQQMLDLLEAWVTVGWLREVDIALVRFFRDEVPGMDPSLMLAAALVSHQLGRGHVCLDLETTLDDPNGALSLPPEQDVVDQTESIVQPAKLLAGLGLDDWLNRLTQPKLVGMGEGQTPLVLAGHRLYLRRYWRYERQVEKAIEQRIADSKKLAKELPEAELRDTLNALFPPDGKGKTNWQKIACAIAAGSAFSIITGGPGTGKTTTVVRLLVLLQSIRLLQDPAKPLAIRLAAPTGKAAARLEQSITKAINHERLSDFLQNKDELKARIPLEATTLHRLLGSRPDTRMFKHNARNPLPLDVLVIDEASMIDLEMMASVLLALPAKARVILLGDKDQLASVEAGSVLGELCRRAQEGHFRSDTAKWIKAVTGDSVPDELQDSDGLPLDQHVVMLRERHRFVAESGIAQLADAVNAGDAAAIRSVWSGQCKDLFRYEMADSDDEKLEGILLGSAGKDREAPNLTGYFEAIKQRPALEADKVDFDDWALNVLEAHGRFQLLCALRHGPCGVAGINQRIESLLAKRYLIDTKAAWYEGRPVLITRNDYQLGLMNGDIGITLRYPIRNKLTGEPEWSTRVAFPKVDGSKSIHWVLPSRLVAVETVYALTVHKSQGSEFEHCALLLPPTCSPVLTRELLYTGITRGKTWFSLICSGSSGIDVEAAERTVRRSGGLF